MKLRGFLNQVVSVAGVSAAAREHVRRISQLAPQAARLNKACFRALAPVLIAQTATEIIANSYTYAASDEHREGIAAFIEKRSPAFQG
jgi:1,4-dihydroxy-2-naphthoyl-CoA synthase